MTKTPVAIVGATGYTGVEILKILLRHPRAEVASLTAKVDGTIKIQDEFPELKGSLDMDCSPVDTEAVCRKAEIVFLSLPHTVSMRFAPAFLKAGKKVIDLSADYRFPRKEDYESWYGSPHADPEGLSHAVYGLPELFRERVKKAKLIANPGCFPTGAILSIFPAAQAGLLASPEAIVDAKSGVTGAGRKASLALLFPEVNENFKAYSLTSHKHTPEIAGVLSAALGKEMRVEFAPHLLPVNRGILSTIYLKLAADASEEALLDLYRRRYGNEPFIRIYPKGALPQLREAVGTNNCLIGLKFNPRTKNLILVAAIDNLLKGAAGQAVQNMNIMQGWEESAGLR